MGRAMTFDDWKQLLQSDCVTHDKLPAFQTLNDIGALKILYDHDVDPTVAAIVASGAPRKEST